MLQLGIRGLGIARFKFNPISWFIKGEPGAWYDPSDLTTLFQDSAGITPMSAVGTVADQPVGLMLDKSKGLALGAELVTNGDFSNGTTGWATDPSWTIASGAATFAYTTALRLIKDFTGVTGKYCILSVNILSTNASGGLYFYVGGTGYFVDTSTVGIKTFMVVWGGTRLTIQPQNTTWAGSITNISIKQIAGNHAFQATPGNRPVLSARVNALLNTEGVFANTTYWVSQPTTVDNIAIAPNGTLTASRLTTTGASNYVTNNGTNTPVSLPVGITHTLTIWVRLVSGTGTFRMYANSPGFSSTQTATAEWKQFSFTFTPVLVVTVIRIFQTYTAGDVVEIWGADLRQTNSGALLPPYQRVNTASDYDTVGFPLYLKANGTSSGMSTNSIDFTSTDKMTVVTGVRKLSDAAISIALELSVIADSNNGTFLLAPSFNGISAAGAYYSAGAKGTNIARVTSDATYTAPISNINTFIDSISTPYAELKINSIQVATNTAGQGTGNFGNYPLYLFARAGTSLFLNGQFYGGIIRGAQSDTASVTQTENYMAQKTGITF